LGKVISQKDLILRRPEWKGNGEKLVFVAGCFDLLHPGHVRLLEQARNHGDIVVVGVFDDASAHAAHAGSARSPASVSRPITPACERSEVLAALAAVDYVFEFDASLFPDLLGRLQPDVAIEGSEPSSPMSLAWAAAKATGLVDVVRIPLEPGHSTSRLIERITQLPA
jgi:rfaE bifunctional protein nucleotidyltransferase chain/domain